MNEEQLKKIVANIKAIRDLIDEDPEASFSVSNELAALESIVLNELKEIVWNNYRKENNI